MDLKNLRKKSTLFLRNDLLIRTTRILDILYIPDPKYNLLLTSTSDGFVKGWRYNQSMFVLATQPDND